MNDAQLSPQYFQAKEQGLVALTSQYSRRPSPNTADACCRCGAVHVCPVDHKKPAAGELGVHQPTPTDPPQWICPRCSSELEQEGRHP